MSFLSISSVFRSSYLGAPPRGIAWSAPTPSRICPKASGDCRPCRLFDEGGTLRGFNPSECVPFSRESCLLGQSSSIATTQSPVFVFIWYSNLLGPLLNSDPSSNPRGSRRKLPCRHDPPTLNSTSLFEGFAS